MSNKAFKDIFYKQLAEKESRSINEKQFVKFLSLMKIYPDLMSSYHLNFILKSILKKSLSEPRFPEISYSQFEKLIIAISEQCFPAPECLNQLISYIKPHCQSAYHIILAPKLTSISKEPSSRSHFKALPTSRVKNASGVQRKILNKSTSQKLSLSGLISPKNNTTMMKKIFDFKSPSLKMLVIRKNKESEGRVQKISKLFEEFKVKLDKIARVSGRHKHVIGFLEKVIEGKMNTVIFI